MNHKGHLTRDGKVVASRDRRDVEVVAEIGYKEQRLNLRRVVVIREWAVKGFRKLAGTLGARLPSLRA